MTEPQGDASSNEAVRSPATSGAQQARQILIWVGYFCGGMAFLYWPILFGPAGVVLGLVNLKRGEKLHGQRQIGLGVVGLVVGVLIGALVNGALSNGCSQQDLTARALEVGANVQRLIATPGRLREGLAAQSQYVELGSRANAAMMRGDMKTACQIIDELERQIK